MAEGYYRESGKLGVVCSTTGPGATSLLTGVASAYAENIPMLVITPQSAMKYFGLKTLQDSHSTGINTVNIFQNCTNYSVLISHPEQFILKLETAIKKAFYPSKGPVHLSIPKDIMDRPLLEGSNFHSEHLSTLVNAPKAVDLQAVESFIKQVATLKNVVIVLGQECDGAIGAILKFASLLQARIVTTCEGKRWITEKTPGYCGVFGFAGHASAKEALSQDSTDCIIAIGTRMTEFSTGSWDTVLLNKKLIHIDNYLDNFLHSTIANTQIFGDIKTILEICNDRLPKRTAYPLRESDIALQDESTPDLLSMPIKPPHLMKKMAEVFPVDTHYLVDPGNSMSWAAHYLFPGMTGKYDSSMDFASMGWSIGGSIGVAFANRNRPVVSIVGDGSFLMYGCEFSVAVEHNLNIIYVILNDQALGMVKHGQRLGGGEPICHTLPEVDFAMLARSMGAKGFIIKSLQELVNFSNDKRHYQAGPCILDVRIDGEAIPPMGTRMKTLTEKSKTLQ